MEQLTDSIWLLPHALSVTIATVAIGLTYLQLYRHRRQSYLLIWTLAWFGLLLNDGLLLLGSVQGTPPLLQGLHQMFSLFIGMLFLWATRLFTGTCFNRRWLLLVPLPFAWGTAAGMTELPFWLQALPSFLLSGTAYVVAGITLLRARRLSRIGRGLGGWALILFGLHQVDYALLAKVEAFAPIGFQIAEYLALLIAIGLLLSLLDSSMRKLSEGEQTYGFLVRHARDIIFRLNMRGPLTVDFVSPSVEEVTGYRSEEIMGRLDQAMLAVPPEDRQAVLEQLRHPSEAPPPMLIRIRSRDGDIVWLEVTIVHRIDRNGVHEAIDGIARDITQRIRSEEQKQRSQKMEAVGRLAGGIAHDFNNMLTTLSGHLAIARRQVAEPETVLKELEGVERALGRAGALTRQLLTFSRGQARQRERIDPMRLIESSVTLIRPLLGESIRIEVDCSGQPGTIIGDEAQLEQVMVNLAINARDAMEQGGLLSIHCSEVQLTMDDLLPADEIAPGRYLRIDVKDTGAGIEDGDMAKIFDPFFTTKAAGKGTGLGLSIVYGVLRQSGGTVRAESELGQGTTLSLLLPLVAGDAAAPSAPDESEPASDMELLRGDDRRLLVVDDDRDVLAMMHRVLRNWGYRVSTARGAEEALSMIELQDDIELLVTDVMMPEVSGVELAERLRAQSWQRPVLFVSGYANARPLAAQIDAGAAQFLEKPFQPQELVMAVQRSLAAR